MCAINGFTFQDETLIKRMNEVTRHRGPDATGSFTDGSVSLGNNRLAIIDLSSLASQPMTSDDSNLVIVYNGELYNYLSLRKELESTYPFRTKSDTEVILAAYKVWGPKCLPKFRGMFAFAIWNKKTRELFIARDHIGIKPLYYFLEGIKLIFSSEIKAILEHGVARTLDKEAFNHYFRILYVPEPHTMFKEVKKFPQAHYAVFDAQGKFTLTRYWEPKLPEKGMTQKGDILVVRDLVERAVANQLVSDRPLGVYLSGGIDSSIVAHTLAKRHEQVNTFSVGFELSAEEEGEKFNADFNLARRTAEALHTRHHELFVRPSDVVAQFEKAVWHMDEPISNPTAIPMKLLAEFTKPHATVVLSGDGGDELFGGYERYRLSLAADYYRSLPSFVRSVLSGNERLPKLNTSPGIEQFALFMFQKDAIVSRVIASDYFLPSAAHDFFGNRFFKRVSSSPFPVELMKTDLESWLVDESLTLGDKMSMAHGIEVRVPLLDVDVVEYAMRLSLKDKVTLFETKRLLRSAFRGKIPEFLYTQPKRGWFSPGAKWLRHDEIRTYAKEVLSPSFYPETKSLFKSQEIERIFEDHHEKREYNLTILWALLTFQLWARRYKVSL